MPMEASRRDAYLTASDEALLRDSTVETYRASGPGGQHRNKTESAVRLTHGPTGVVVTATERRSQHRNRRKAVHRLRRAIAMEVRAEADPALLPRGEMAEAVAGDAWPRLPRRPAAYLVVAARALDRLDAAAGRASAAAAGLGVSTASFVKFLSLDDDLWQEANRIRVEFGEKPLRKP